MVADLNWLVAGTCLLLSYVPYVYPRSQDFATWDLTDCRASFAWLVVK
jgi:hypothetical protein